MTALERKDGNGNTRREALLFAGERIEEPYVAPQAAHVMPWFWEVDAFRTFDQHGHASAVLPSELSAWALGTKTAVEDWEFSALLAMDRARRNALAQPIEAVQPSITPDMFDAMLGGG